MPLAVGAGSVEAPDIPGPYVPRPVKPADIPQITWVDPSGTSWRLTDYIGAPFFIPAPGPTGLMDAAPISIISDKRDRGGAFVRHIQPQSRVPTIPLYIEADDRRVGQPDGTHDGFVRQWRELARAFTMTSRYGPGQIIVKRPGGSSRAINAYYQDGFQGDPGYGVFQDSIVLTLFCPQAYWRDLTPTPFLRSGSATGGKNFFKRFPRVASSQTLGSATAFNVGDVEAWPLWTITGPASTVLATNTTRGESWALNINAFRGSGLAAGESITVNTETGEIVGPAVGAYGTDWTGAVDWTASVLWRLDPGENKLAFTIGGQAAGTSISASYYAHYETA